MAGEQSSETAFRGSISSWTSFGPDAVLFERTSSGSSARGPRVGPQGCFIAVVSFRDETGYVSISRTGATLFFSLVNRRYDVGFTILTSNQSPEKWGHIFGDEVMADGLIDWPLHHCHIVNIRSNSYGMRQHAERLTTLQNNSATRLVTSGRVSPFHPPHVSFLREPVAPQQLVWPAAEPEHFVQKARIIRSVD